MAITAKIDVKTQDILRALRDFFKNLLELDEIKAILVPQHLPAKNMVMPTLVTQPDHLNGADPLAPAFPMNTAKIIAKLTRRPSGAKIVAVARPCEIRAFFELVKLKQGSSDEVVLVGIDCLGAYSNKDYARWIEQNGNDATLKFYKSILSEKGGAIDGIDLAAACKACEHPVANGADISIGLYGIDHHDQLLIQSQTEAGANLLSQLELTKIDEPASRKDAIAAVVARRTAYRDEMFAKTHAVTDSLEKMAAYFASCINCYNCRVACPVCYCKECVFVTDVFNHDPSQYLRWASRKGIIKMPTDTLFYHITRLAHMSTACVGCGQCSNACPNDIPVMELFRTVAQGAQQAFEYEAGKSLEHEPPLSTFREDEFQEVVGISNFKSTAC
jgi:formate dehydrogenase subunit beta